MVHTPTYVSQHNLGDPLVLLERQEHALVAQQCDNQI